MIGREIRRTWTPHGWIEHLEPDWDRLREILAATPEPPAAERLAASLRYAAAMYEQTGKDARP